MIIGTVIGTVICTRKNCNLVGSKFLIVEPMEKMHAPAAGRIVAVDNVGAGIGDIVLVTMGSAARIGCDMEHSSVDAAIVGIVDDARNIDIRER